MASQELTPLQQKLQTRIVEFVERESCSHIEYHSEWSGYLPFGCYHWISCNGCDITVSLEYNWNAEDLSSLEVSGFLIKISDSRSINDEMEKTILYLVNYTNNFQIV